ncbi:MAG: TIGR03118 family protein [Verrucomicrobiota bacterium]
MTKIPLFRGRSSRTARLGFALLVSGVACGPSAVRALTTNVVFNNFAYTPPVVTIQPGDTVLWTNEGGSHTVTGDGTDPFCGGQEVATSCATTFTNIGTFPYHCVFHRSFGMTGTVIVVSATVTNPPPTSTNRITDPIPAKIAKSGVTVELVTVATNLVSPLGVAAPDDGSGRLFLYDQVGVVHVLSQGGVTATPLLDVRDRLVALQAGYDERGLLGLAVHPNFVEHPLIYTYTSEPTGPAADFPIPGINNDHQQVIAEWRIDTNATNRIDPASRRELLRLDKPQSNHNGGTIHFGADGMLYFAVGDGGAADDQGPGHSDGGNGQDRTRMLGKMGRIDVDGRTSTHGQYAVPADNPFLSEPGTAPEIFALGLRNPYSFNFDMANGDLYLGDVGQNNVEEVDRIVKGGNFGWPIKEGGFFFDPNGTNEGFVTSVPVRAVPADLVEPIGQYDHDEGEAIIGGVIYRGAALPALAGKYVFGDLGDPARGGGRLFYLEGSEVKELTIGGDDRPLGFFLKGIGQDRSGEVYLLGSTNLGPSGNAGRVVRLASAATNMAGNAFVTRNLVSDQLGQGDVVDARLLNPWGLALSATSPFWIADNHGGLSTLHNSTGGVQALVVTIPAAPGSTNAGSPTGVLFNSTTNFPATTNAARFIFVSEDGVISAWSGGSNAVLKVDNSATGAIYTGVALGNDGGSNLLYAANFHAGTVDIFNGNFAAVARPGAFADTNIPPDFAPFNVESLGGKLYVTYAQQDEEKEDEVPGAGKGFVNRYDFSGNLQSRLVAGGPLNAPWGLALAPSWWNAFPGALLVGNFGDGRINAFDPESGAFLGALSSAGGVPIQIDGLWAIKFGNGGQGGDPGVLYFTAGPGDEEHGLFGSIAPASYLRIIQTTRVEGNLTITWVGGTPPYAIQLKNSLNETNWTTLTTTSALSARIPASGTAAFLRVSDQAALTP